MTKQYKMASRAKKVIKQKPSDSLREEKRGREEKENMCLDKLPKEKRKCMGFIKLQREEVKKKEQGTACLSPQKEKFDQKAVGFWSKKLRDLEFEKGVVNEEKCSLYEFNGTGESQSHKKKKASKQKVGISKKKKAAASKCNKLIPLHQKLKKEITQSERKLKQIHRHSLFREKIMLSKEREQLADRGKKFTFSTGMPSLGITSTPALNKDNLIGASNFLFLSPIIKEDAETCINNIECKPIKPRTVELPIVNTGLETELHKVSFRRVLRNGKILNT